MSYINVAKFIVFGLGKTLVLINVRFSSWTDSSTLDVRFVLGKLA